MTTMELPDIQQLNPKTLVPYDNNARTITEEAIKAVMDSITRFGFVQPIVVDSDMSILVGHTRREAALRMGLESVPVIVDTKLTDEKRKEYRLIDNKTGEMTSWDLAALQLELREFEAVILDTYFPEIDLGVENSMGQEQISDDILRRTEEKVMTINKQSDMSAHETKVECPSCQGQFSVRTKSLPGLTWDDFSALLSGTASTE